MQERSLTSLKASWEAMKSTHASLQEEIGTDLLSQLGVEDQREVDKLNDEIRFLTQESKNAFSERMRVS